jgi:uncharacterized protein YlxW (UPF0749 family)
MSFSKLSNVVLVVVLGVVVGVLTNVSSGRSATTTQDVSSLDRRLSLLEQRFYSVESNISRLQQFVASQRPPISQPTVSDRDTILMREEIQRLSLRVTELECGLLKLDERTATRKSTTTKPSDPCRLNPETPLRLPSRP